MDVNENGQTFIDVTEGEVWFFPKYMLAWHGWLSGCGADDDEGAFLIQFKP